jgi:hypothetical protein
MRCLVIFRSVEGTRIKTDVRLTPVVAHAAEEMARSLGIPKNAVISFALAYMYLSYGALSPKGRKRLDLLESLEKQVREAFAEAKRAA